MPPRKKVVAPDAVETVKPRKSKKAVKVVAVVTPNGIQGNFNPEPRKPLIAHLEIHSNEVVFPEQQIRYDPTPPVAPEPYDPSIDDIYHGFQASFEEETVVEEKSSELVKYEEKEVVEARPLQVFTKCDLMIEYNEANKNNKLPETTTIACYWCAHSFNNQPCIIPEIEKNGLYKVYGNFCCPECAVAYLLKESIDPHVRWERLSLLNRIYDVDGNTKIYPAPPRESLQLFGGPLSIESYRATIFGKKVRVDLHMPPIVSIIGSIDTKPIDFYDTSLKNQTTLLPFDKIQKVEEGLRLKRSKPLKDKGNTLDDCINIEIKNKK